MKATLTNTQGTPAKVWRKRMWLLMLPIICLTLCPSAESAGTSSIMIELNADNRSHAIADTFYGLFYEDINQAGDGGLYAELVNNRSFEAQTASSGGATPFSGWYFNSGKLGEGVYKAAYDDPLYDTNPSYVQIQVTQAPYVIANNGYSANSNPDMYFIAGESYALSIYLRSAAGEELTPFDGEIVCRLEDADGNAISDEQTIQISADTGATWQMYSVSLTASAEGKGRLALRCEGTGSFDMDFVSLMPSDTWGYGEETWKNSGLRRDLVEALAALNPGFIRFPGGCIVEGAYRHETHYNWKDTIGPIEQRKENVNLWGYMMSYGLGYHEYFQLCEDLGAVPVPVLHAGLLCQARRSGDNTEADWKPGDAEFDGLIQDYLDLIEYANGGTDTVWGAKRAENGHPEPFGLRMIGIGNENWGEEYWTNFKAIREAVLAVYPEIDIITTTGPLAEGWINSLAWKHINADYTDAIVDEHYYMAPQWFLTNTKRYDAYARNGARIFVGEYAAHEEAEGGRRPNTLYSALCEAAYITGLERNADIVTMTSYAPLFARAGMFQWSPDMIWFNSKEITNLTPNYWVQQMFSANTGDYVISPSSTLDTKQLFQSSSVDLVEKAVYTKLVNPYPAEKTVTISYTGYGALYPTAQTTILSGLQNATSAAPVTGEAVTDGGGLTLILPPYSLTVAKTLYGAAEPAETTEPTISDSPNPESVVPGDPEDTGGNGNNILWIAAAGVVVICAVTVLAYRAGKRKLVR